MHRAYVARSAHRLALKTRADDYGGGRGLGTKLTRRDFVKAAGAGGAWLALFGLAGCESGASVRASTPPARVG